MKKAALFPLFLLLCLSLTACGGSKSISGEVVDVLQTAENDTVLVLQPASGDPVGLCLDADAHIFGGPDGFDSSAYEAAPHTGVELNASVKGPADTLTTAAGNTLKLYHVQDQWIYVEACLTEDAYTLSDGTPLDIWESSWNDVRYQLKNGTELLREDNPFDPENVSVGSLEDYDALSPAAQAAVTKLYANQGKLYDLDAMLEQAYAEYQAAPESFCSYWVFQDTSSDASSQQVMYFSTNLTVCVAQEPGLSGSYVQTQYFSIQTAFDRETGKVIPAADLFTCPESQLGKKLLNTVDWLKKDPVKEEMIDAFSLDYLSVSQDGIYMVFPAGSLPSQELEYHVGADLTDDCRALLQPWAVPTAPEP